MPIGNGNQTPSVAMIRNASVPKGIHADRQWEQLSLLLLRTAYHVPKGIHADRQWELKLF